ncbi:hypothetical protein [Enterobacter cloacae]
MIWFDGWYHAFYQHHPPFCQR